MSDFNRQSVDTIIIPMVLTRDPDNSTIELQLVDGGTWHPCTWLGEETTRPASGDQPATWKQEAETNQQFAGPDVVSPPPGAVLLDLARYFPRTRVSWPDGRVVVRATFTSIELTD